MNTFIALDVGGTSIKTSVITPNGTLLTPGIALPFSCKRR